jgi:endonuclease/exonuclease/phosphatase family metal-dependent hydrolase
MCTAALASTHARSELRVADVIASLGADLVGLQELNVRRLRSGAVDQAAIIAQQLGWNPLFQPALQNPDEDLGDAIISRYPLRLIRTAELPGPSPWYCREPRVALWARHKILPESVARS